VQVLEIVGIALALAMDAFAVALGVGAALGRPKGRQFFRLAWHFGLFQFMMPIVGWGAGRYVADFTGGFDHWVAFALLVFIGAKMIWEAVRSHDRRRSADPTRGLSLVALSVATSIDALAVGLTFAFLGVRVWEPAVVIGVVAGVLTLVGLAVGAGAGRLFGRWAEVAGGCVLIAIGVKVVVNHLVV